MSGENYCPEVKKISVGCDSSGNQIEIVYFDAGSPENQSLLLIDGYIGKEGWLSQLELLSQDYYVVAIDPIGFGSSSKPAVKTDDDYTYKWQAEKIRSFINILQLKNPWWIGVDPFATLAFEYFRLYSKDPLGSLKGIVVVNGGANSIVDNGTNNCEQLYMLSWENALQLVAGFGADPLATSTFMISTSFITSTDFAKTEKIKQYAIEKFAKMPLDVFTRLFTVSYAKSQMDIIGMIDIPILVIYSYKDFQTNSTFGEFYKGVNSIRSGYCEGCNINPDTGEQCSGNFYYPGSKVKFVEIRDKPVPVHAFSVEKFNEEVVSFITNADLEGSVSNSVLNLIDGGCE